MSYQHEPDQGSIYCMVTKDSARPGTIANDPSHSGQLRRPAASTLENRRRTSTFGASRQARLNHPIGPGRSGHGSVVSVAVCRGYACHRPSSFLCPSRSFARVVLPRRNLRTGPASSGHRVQFADIEQSDVAGPRSTLPPCPAGPADLATSPEEQECADGSASDERNRSVCAGP
jgi:hypothetical protein